MTDFNVRVTRYLEDKDGISRSYFGFYVSKVYAIDKDADRFLVYDPGDYEIAGGFEWVDYTATMIPLTGEVEEGVCRVPVVELVEDDT